MRPLKIFLGRNTEREMGNEDQVCGSMVMNVVVIVVMMMVIYSIDINSPTLLIFYLISK
jgi:Ca2+/Na+ antiporter